MKTFRYEIPVWAIQQAPIDAENPPEHVHVFEGEAEFEDFHDAWDHLVESCPWIVDFGEVMVEEVE